MTPQAKKVLRHMQQNTCITPVEAFKDYGIFRLAARIWELKKTGYEIETVIDRDAQKKPYARYSLTLAARRANAGMASMYGAAPVMFVDTAGTVTGRLPCRPSPNPLAFAA